VKQVTAHRFLASHAALTGAVALGVVAAGAAWTDEERWPPKSNPESSRPSLSATREATSSAPRPLTLLLTQSELLAVVRNFGFRTGEVHPAPAPDPH
jgi:hypothetical protein